MTPCSRKKNQKRPGGFVYQIVLLLRTPFTHALRTATGMCTPASYPHSGLGQVGPHGDLLPGAHVRVAVPLEGGLQLLELLAGEVSPLPPLLLLLGVVPGAVIAPVLGAPLLLCGSQCGEITVCESSCVCLHVDYYALQNQYLGLSCDSL